MKKTQQKEIENVTNITGVRQIELWRRDDLQHPRLDEVAEEVPVALVYNGISHVVMMASPKDLELFAIGFSLSEGIIEHPQDIYGMDVVQACNGLEVQIELSSRRFMGLKERRRALADPFFRAEIDNFAGVRCLFEARSGTKNGSAMRSGQQPLLFQLAEIGTNGSARYIKDVTHLRNSNFAFFPENTE